MNAAVKTLFTQALREYTGNEVRDSEYVCSGTLEGYDAYGLLCVLHMGVSHSPVSFVPVTGVPFEFYYYPREAMLAWSELTKDELSELLLWATDGLPFKEIADLIDEEWA